MMFKQVVAMFLVVTTCLTINNIFFEEMRVPIAPQTKNISGAIVVYHENRYQRHAIDLLIQEDKLEHWTCLYTLWTRESNWNPNSLNKKSKAYGIAQFMPETWELVGYKKTDNGFTQVEAGLAYLERKYGGNICKALGSNLGRGWY